MKKNKKEFGDSFVIGERKVGLESSTYVIAEVGSNHNQDLEQAKDLISASAEAGADAVKFQTLDYECLFHDGSTDEEVANLYDRIELPEEWYPELQSYSDGLGVAFLSSPTYPEGVDLLAGLDVPAYKVASAQVAANTSIVRRIAGHGKPIILSTGLGGYSPVESALKACLEVGNRKIAVLHCVSEYPTDAGDAQLRRMKRLESAFGTIVGFSDHTESLHIPAAAVALGADIIEKHITLDRDLDGPDHHYAREPHEFNKMVDGIREVEKSLGTGVKLGPTKDEEWLQEHVQMKLVTSSEIEEGALLTEDAVIPRRSPQGIPFDLLSNLAGNIQFDQRMDSDTLITWDCLTGVS